MKKIPFLLFICLPFVGFGQFQSSIDLASGIFLSDIANFENNVLTGPTSTIINEKYEPRPTSFFAVHYNHQIKEKWYLKSGIRYSGMAYATENRKGLVWGSEIQDGLATGMGPIFDPSLPHEIQFIYKQYFLEIPILSRYEFKHKIFTPYIEAGLSPGYLVIGKTIRKTDLDTKEFDQNTADVNKFQVTASISLGINFQVSPNSQGFLQPTFRQHIRTTYQRADARAFSYGIEVGLRKQLK